VAVWNANTARNHVWPKRYRPKKIVALPSQTLTKVAANSYISSALEIVI
jgi:hypothetical protein